MRKEGQGGVAEALTEGTEELSGLPLHGLPREGEEMEAAMFSLLVVQEPVERM